MLRVIQAGLLCATLACAQMPRNQIPQNLDFREGVGHWTLEHTSLEVRHEDCASSPACAVITGGNIKQTPDVALYRGKPIRLSAWLRNGAQLWLRVNRPNQPVTLLDNLADKPVRSAAWTLSEIMLVVATDADSIEFGVSSLSGNPAGVRDVSLDVLDELPLIPHNLDFAEGEAGQSPPGWSAPHALETSEGCHTGASCGIVSDSGSLTQTLNAAPYRGKTVRLRAWVKLEASKLETSAPSAIAHLSLMDDTREIRGATWTGYEVTRTIDPGSDTITFGLSTSGKGSARIDEVFLDVVAEGKPASASLGALPSLASTLSGLAPSLDDTRQFINNAAHIAMAWDKALPNFICTQTIRRAENRYESGWKEQDVLAVQLGSADGKEYHKLVSVNNKPPKVTYESLKGAISEGEFGGTLREVFRAGAAVFTWDSDASLRGHPVRVFRYDIDVAKSGLTLRFPPALWSRIVGHHGLVYLDRDSGQALRVVQIADVPADAPVRASKETMDFDYSDVGGNQYLLPLSAEVVLATSTIQFRNAIEFHDYRKFTAESSLSFDEAK